MLQEYHENDVWAPLGWVGATFRRCREGKQATMGEIGMTGESHLLAILWSHPTCTSSV